MEPKAVGLYYKDTHEKDPQFIETAILASAQQSRSAAGTRQQAASRLQSFGPGTVNSKKLEHGCGGRFTEPFRDIGPYEGSIWLRWNMDVG